MQCVGERSSEAGRESAEPNRPNSSANPNTDSGSLVFNTVKNLHLILRLIKISFEQNISINIKGEQ